MIHLLDVNVLIALCDPAHPHAAAASRFFDTHARREGWATCPLVENGVLRILGGRNYPGGPGSPQKARIGLASLLSSPGHQFWPDDLSLFQDKTFPALPPSGDLTDFYLLGLAIQHGGRFATFDQKFEASLLPGGPQALLLLPTIP